MAGTITGGNLNTGVLTISSQFGGVNQTVNVTRNTQFATQTTVTVADLNVDDQIQVQGVPTGITASSITAGQMPTFLRGGMGGGFGSNPRNVDGRSNRGTQGNQPGQSQSFASANGSVVSVSPLTLNIGNHMTLVVKLAADAKVTRISGSTLADLKIGDKIVASGQTDANGTFTATGVGVNLNVGNGFGPGGPGGFGPGGPGGFGPGGPGGRGPGGPGGPGGSGGPGGGGPDSGEPPNN